MHTAKYVDVEPNKKMSYWHIRQNKKLELHMQWSMTESSAAFIPSIQFTFTQFY